jgi:uncharacterized YigZ family protein
MPEADIYKTLAGKSEGVYKEKGSRFIAFAFPVEDAEAAKKGLEAIRKQYHDARHHCYAYLLGPEPHESRMSDDGEPGGTAGRPIHGQLLSFGLTNAMVVVVRYFGGIKLGTGGLVQAYKSAAREALSQGTLVERTWDMVIGIRFGYERLSEIMRILKDEGARISSQELDQEPFLMVEIRKSKCPGLVKRLEGLERVEISII